MRSQLPEHALGTLLGQCFKSLRCQSARSCWPTFSRCSKSLHTSSPSRRRRASASFEKQCKQFHTQSGASADVISSPLRIVSAEPASHHDYVLRAEQHGQTGEGQPHHGTRIAVLGGGITGLASAHYLAKELPYAKITVYEKSDRLGGWLQSKKVDVGNGNVLFEQGPRSLRPGTPSGLVTLEIIKDLGLEDQVLITPMSSNSARNRFIYYPDHLVKMPGPGQDFYSIAWSVLTEPVFRGLIKALLFEGTRPQRESRLEDESVGSFLSRRLGTTDIGNNIVSAFLHGVYAGDINQLSMKSLFPGLWNLEAVFGSFSKAYRVTLPNAPMLQQRDIILNQQLKPKLQGPLLDSMRSASVYSFKEGISTLSNALATSLKANPNVQFKMSQEVNKIEYDAKAEGVTIQTTSNHPPVTYTNCISTLPASSLATLTPSVSSLAGIHAVTVMVVNLYYKDPHLLPEQGFGYLIPRSIPFEQNPEMALGVVFDSDCVAGQDTAAGTKITVMIGGHWWDTFSGAEYPDEEEGAAMAKNVLHRHLGINEEPHKVHVSLQRDCIPQYVVGHSRRMKTAHDQLMAAFEGKLSVAGNSYTGVGLNDCVRAARDVVLGIKDRREYTGLESFASPSKWVTPTRGTSRQ